jgi:hypothetical protein
MGLLAQLLGSLGSLVMLTSDVRLVANPVRNFVV